MLIVILISIVVLVMSVILHEIMHGFVADKLGDPTARIAGRLTLNPLPHIDPLFSIIIPALLLLSGSSIIFGSAKPVPINPNHFKDFRKDIALTALAGPATNLFLALLGAVVFHVFRSYDLIALIGLIIVRTNLSLGILNLMPIPPIDGSKVLIAFLPTELATSYLSLQRYGMLILFLLLFNPFGGFGLNDIIGKMILKALELLGIPPFLF